MTSKGLLYTLRNESACNLCDFPIQQEKKNPSFDYIEKEFYTNSKWILQLEDEDDLV